ncbi:MAG: HAD family hydrolase [Hyphomicrobiaceae bacterium]
MLQALIFDVDGTLAETEEAHREAFNRVFSEAGLAWHWDQPLYRRLLEVTGGKERIAYFLRDFDPPRDGVPSDPSMLKDWIAGLHARKTTIYNAIISEGGVPLRPGVEPLIRHARNAGVRLAIATTTSLPNVESLLVATLGPRWPELFETIAAGDMVGAKKPAPDVFLLALERLGLHPLQCLALEDSENGVASARGAGLMTVVTRSTYTDHQTFDGAALVLPDLSALAGDAAAKPVEGQAILTALRHLAAAGA